MMYLKTTEQLPSHWLMTLQRLDLKSQRKQSHQGAHHFCIKDTGKPDLNLLKTTFKNRRDIGSKVFGQMRRN